MARKPSLRALGALAFALLLVSAGCTQNGQVSGMSAKQIGQQAQQKYSQLKSYQGTMRITSTGLRNKSSTARVWAKPHQQKIRFETIAPPAKAGTLFVSNGSVLWTYNATSGKARRTELDNFGQMTPTQNYSAMFANLTKDYNITYNGKTSVSGHETYNVTLTPKQNATSTGFVDHETLWLDTDHWFPIKNRFVGRFAGKTSTTTITYTNITFNENISDSRFEFTPSANASVKHVNVGNSSLHHYDSLAAVRANVSYDVPTPAVPDGYSFANATVARYGSNATVSLTYKNATGTQLMFDQQPQTGSARTPPGANTVTIHGSDGYYTSFGNRSVASWHCGGYDFQVSGDVSKSTALATANATTCPT